MSPATSAFLGSRLLLSSMVVAAVAQLVCWHLHVHSPPAPSPSPPVPRKPRAPQTLRAKGNDKSSYRISQLNRVINLKGRRCWQLQHRCSGVDSGGSLELLGGQHWTCSSTLPPARPPLCPAPGEPPLGRPGFVPAQHRAGTRCSLSSVSGAMLTSPSYHPRPAPASGAPCPWHGSQRLQQGRLYSGSSFVSALQSARGWEHRLRAVPRSASPAGPGRRRCRSTSGCTARLRRGRWQCGSRLPCPNPSAKTLFGGQSPAQKPSSEL